MKATELMVGDYLQTIVTRKKVRVKEIKQSCIYTVDNGYEYNEIQPIPLTLEILEKNGFICTQKENEEDGEYECWSFHRDCCSIIYEPTVKMLEVHNGGDNGSAVRTAQFYTDGNVLFVHELQHLLIMCNINLTIEL